MTLYADHTVTIKNQMENKKAIRNQEETIKLIDSIGGLHGNVLDIGNRNYLTELLEKRYNVEIQSTSGDLDKRLYCPEMEYDFIHYNNVIEHQFNPLLTLLEIREGLTDGGIIILGTPLKPKWITTALCHFHEFDEVAYKLLMDRAGLIEVKRVHFWREWSIKGVRPFLGSFYYRQLLVIFKTT